jgi:hypothetical protein
MTERHEALPDFIRNQWTLGFAAASLTHFFVKLVRAAPDSFFSVAATSQALAAASLSHFLMKLFSAAPCSFFSVAWAAQSGPAGVVWAKAAVEIKAPATQIPAVKILIDMLSSQKYQQLRRRD